MWDRTAALFYVAKIYSAGENVVETAFKKVEFVKSLSNCAIICSRFVLSSIHILKNFENLGDERRSTPKTIWGGTSPPLVREIFLLGAAKRLPTATPYRNVNGFETDVSSPTSNAVMQGFLDWTFYPRPPPITARWEGRGVNPKIVWMINLFRWRKQR